MPTPASGRATRREPTRRRKGFPPRLSSCGAVQTPAAKLYLNPAFVVDAPPALPETAGEHRIVGRTASGDELFSVDFAMPMVADSDGSSSFAFRSRGRAGLGR